MLCFSLGFIRVNPVCLLLLTLPSSRTLCLSFCNNNKKNNKTHTESIKTIAPWELPVRILQLTIILLNIHAVPMSALRACQHLSDTGIEIIGSYSVM